MPPWLAAALAGEELHILLDWETFGQWHYPNGSVVPTSQDGTLLFTSRSNQGILSLKQRIDFQETIPGVDGVYKCQIPDINGRTQTLSAWIFSGPLCKFSALLHFWFGCVLKCNTHVGMTHLHI